MNLDGHYRLAAPPEYVWTLLHNPGVLQKAVPGCERLEQLDPKTCELSWRIEQGPFRGNYHGHIFLEAPELAPYSCRLRLEATGPEGRIRAQGSLTLEAEEDHTVLHFAGELDSSGPTAVKTPRLLKTTGNALLRQFVEGLNLVVQEETGEAPPDLRLTPAPRLRRSGAIGARDWVEELRRNRRMTILVLLFLLLAVLVSLGALVVVLLLFRWGARYFLSRVAQAEEDEQQDLSS